MFVGDLVKSILSTDATTLLNSRAVPTLRILLLLTPHADRCASLWKSSPFSWLDLDTQSLEGLWQVVRAAHLAGPRSGSGPELISTGMTLLHERLLHTPDDRELPWPLLRSCMVGAVEVRSMAHHRRQSL